MQQRNVVSNIVSLDSDARELLSLSLQLTQVQIDSTRPCIAALSPSAVPTELARLQMDLDGAHESVRAAIVEDRMKWESIATARLDSLSISSENLAVQLSIPPEALAPEISQIKSAIRTISDGPCKRFLERALSDYRIMNNLNAFSGGSFEIDMAFMVDCTVRLTCLLYSRFLF